MNPKRNLCHNLSRETKRTGAFTSAPRQWGHVGNHYISVHYKNQGLLTTHKTKNQKREEKVQDK